MVRHDQDTSTGDEGCMGIFGNMEKCQWYFFTMVQRQVPLNSLIPIYRIFNGKSINCLH